jgi:hypothetical protein
MRVFVPVLAFLTVSGAAFAQTQVYTPSAADPSVPTFINGVVVRVNPSERTITFRSDGRDSVVMVEGEALAGLTKLRAGDQVMLGYRVNGNNGRVVTTIRSVTPSAAATGAPSTTIQSVRVVGVDPGRRTLTIANTSKKGGRERLTVARDAWGSLRAVRAGDEVLLSYRPGGRVVVRIEPVGVSAGGVTQVSNVITPATSTITTTTTTDSTPIVVRQPPVSATGGIPLPTNQPGSAAVLQPVPNVGPPTSPTLNVALPPSGSGTVPDSATAAQAEAIRAQALRDFQSASGVLALKANEIDGLWFAFKDLCLGGTTPSGATSSTGREWFILVAGTAMPPPGDDACRQRLADLNRATDLFQQQLANALDPARKADIPPGTIREVLQRNRIDR